MQVVFTENNKTLKLSIDGYEFPLESSTNAFDANWLTVKLEYILDGETQTYTDNCLLAGKLEFLTEKIAAVVENKKTGLAADFMEPNLKFAITQVGDIYTVQIRYVYDTPSECKDICISQDMNKEELKKLNAELKSLSSQFPVRKTGAKSRKVHNAFRKLFCRE
jgi:hypothetical protein